jgi:hypothetical protein
MSRPRWLSWTLLVLAAVLILLGIFMLGFLSEPSAVGRMRGALYVIGAGSIVLGLASGAGGVWMLVSRRT